MKLTFEPPKEAFYMPFLHPFLHHRLLSSSDILNTNKKTGICGVVLYSSYLRSDLEDGVGLTGFWSS